jgi:hypothetical protein
MPGLINDLKKSVDEYKSELFSLKSKVLNVNRSVCNLDDVVNSIQTSTQTQENKIAALESFNNKLETFISDVVRIDGDVADLINKNKDDFYNEYNYLKPDSEKNWFEKRWDDIKSAAEWCKEHWKLIVTIVIVVVAVILICTGVGGILGAAALGALIGAGTGGLMGGLSSMAAGGSFWEGFEDGAFTGAITGALMGGLGGLGQIAGNSIKCVSALGKTISVVSKVSGALTITIGGFDMLAFGIGLFDPNNALVRFNQTLHSSELYNGFQFTVGALAAFSGGAASTMKCFVAGTLVATAVGYVAIEKIKTGDKVVSTDAETFKVANKTVVETYIRETTELVHLTINGELIKSTPDHPFYVKDVGFVTAGELYIGDKLLDFDGNTLIVEDTKTETLEEPVKVYNFQVEDFHTYHVGQLGVLVHNADYVSENRVPQDRETVLGDRKKFSRTNIREKGASVYKGDDGKYYHRDTLHTGKGAELEVYNSRGQHIGVADPLTGQIRPGSAIPGREIKP